MATPTLKHLRYLAAVYETRNFSRAADLCNVTQSSLSGAIADLEGLLGLALFERTRRRVVPTAAARALVEPANQVLRQANTFMEIAAVHRDPFGAPLSMGVIPTVAPFLLDTVLSVLRHAYPHLRVTLREDQTERLLARLDAGDLDVLILAFPFETPGTERTVFMADRFWIACAPDHPLAAEAIVDPERIAPDQLLVLEDGHCLRDHVLAACHIDGGGEGRLGTVQGTSLYTVLQMVAEGLGVTLVPEMAVGSSMLAGIPVVYRRIPPALPGREIGLCWRATSARTAQFAEMGRLLAEAYRPAAAAQWSAER